MRVATHKGSVDQGAKPATVVVPFGGLKLSSGGEETIVDQTGTPPEHAIWNN